MILFCVPALVPILGPARLRLGQPLALCGQPSPLPTPAGHGPEQAAPLAQPPALAAVRELLEARGRLSLAQVGEHLRATETPLPEGIGSLTAFVEAHGDTFALSGRPSNRLVALAEDTTAAALVRTVAAVLRDQGATSTTELKLRLSERGQYVPGLSTLLRRHAETFVVRDGTVALREEGEEDGGGDDSSEGGHLPPPMRRLLSLAIPSSMAPHELPAPAALREVLLIDMDNNAFALEQSVARATGAAAAAAAAAAADGGDGGGDGGVLVLAFAATTHNPRVTPAAAERMEALAAAGRLRLLTPVRDTKNAADFVLSFWVGWLHARLPPTARVVLASADIHLERTVVDLLRAEGREALANPDWLSPLGGGGLSTEL